MSYFVFGLIEFEVAEGEVDLAATEDKVRSCGSKSQITVKLRDRAEPPILNEMRGSYARTSALPFLLTKAPIDDTSDELISPFVVGLEGSERAAYTLGRWIGCVLDTAHVRRVVLWMTEGYDDTFTTKTCPPDKFGPVVIEAIRAAADVPSLKVDVARHLPPSRIQ